MSEVMETLAFDETILKGVLGNVMPPELPTVRVSLPATVESAARAKTRWCSSLGEHELRCLIQVIEVDLIPQLLNSYSPARQAPLDRLDSNS